MLDIAAKLLTSQAKEAWTEVVTDYNNLSEKDKEYVDKAIEIGSWALLGGAIKLAWRLSPTATVCYGGFCVYKALKKAFDEQRHEEASANYAAWVAKV